MLQMQVGKRAYGKVVKVKCVICAKYESRIKNIKGFSTSWIIGTSSVKKDSLEKHLPGEKHKKAKELLGPEKYQREVLSTSAIGQGIKKMNETDKEVFLHVNKLKILGHFISYSKMIEKQLYGKWLVPRSTDKLQVGNFSITYGSTQKENSYFWLWFPEHHIWCGSTLHKYFLYLDCFPF